jgi:prepilin-type N-terminal cleavage/methylation domain-containing protein
VRSRTTHQHHQPQQQQQRGERRGFTLIEILVALALSGLLLLAINAAMQHYWRLSTVGRIDAERMQIARSLNRRLAMDLRSMLYEEPPAGGSAAASTTSTTSTSDTGDASDTAAAPVSSASTAATESDPTAATDPLTLATAHLVGGPQSLTFATVRPRRNRIAYLAAQSAVNDDDQSDVRRVSYYYQAGSAGSGGLYYSNADQRYVEWAASYGTSAAAQPGELLAPEVAGAQFEYFDATTATWLPNWNSDTYGGLPRAVRVTFVFQPATAAASRLLAESITSPSTEQVTFTIDLPAAPLPEVY